MKDIDAQIAPTRAASAVEQEAAQQRRTRRLAVRTVASAAQDARECRELLAMLDLHPSEGVTAAA